MYLCLLMDFGCALFGVVGYVVGFRFGVLWICVLVLGFLFVLIGCLLFIVYFVVCGFNGVVLCCSLCL